MYDYAKEHMCAEEEGIRRGWKECIVEGFIIQSLSL
jgi:hypothetical protein